MSNLPGVTINLEDNALGIVPAGSNEIEVKLGVCSAGVAGSLYSFTDLTTLSKTLGLGPLVESTGIALTASGSNCLCLPVNPSAAGGATAVTHTGSDTGTVSVGFGPAEVIELVITADGYSGAAGMLAFSVGGAPLSPSIVIPASPWIVPGTLTSVTFAASPSEYIHGDTFLLNLDGSVTHTGSGAALSATSSSSLDNYEVQVLITADGYAGTATFQISLDNGNDFSPVTQIPTANSGKFVVLNTGMVLTFGQSPLHFTTNEVYSFETVTAGYTNSDLSNSLALLSTTYRSVGFSMIHVIGYSTTAATTAATAAILDAACLTLFNQGKYVVAILECPTLGSIIPGGSPATAAIDVVDTDAALQSAFVNFVSPFVGVGAGDVAAVSSITGRIDRRNMAWPLMGRLSMVAPGTDAAKVKSGSGLSGGGSVPSVVAIYRNENATPGLDAARFCTMRTFDGLGGFFITNAKTMAELDSDYLRLANRRVINEACTIVRTAALQYVNDDLRLNRLTGTILEVVAQQIEADINSKLNAGLVNTVPPDASGASVSVNRNTNILATQTLNITVRVQPKGYSEFVNVDLGFAVSLS